MLSKGRVSAVLSRLWGDTLPGNALDFYQRVLWKSGHFNGRPGGFVIPECLFIDAVDGSEVVHRL